MWAILRVISALASVLVEADATTLHSGCPAATALRAG